MLGQKEPPENRVPDWVIHVIPAIPRVRFAPRAERQATAAAAEEVGSAYGALLWV